MESINIDINKMPTETCAICKCPFFKKTTIIKKIPKLLAGNSEDQFLNVDFMICEHCKHPHSSNKITILQKVPAAKTSIRENQ